MTPDKRIQEFDTTPDMKFANTPSSPLVSPVAVKAVCGQIEHPDALLSDDSQTTRMISSASDKPFIILDMGPSSIGGYPLLDVTALSAKAQIRIAYACWYPYILDSEHGEKGDCARRFNNTYLKVDLPVMPASPDRHEVHTIHAPGTVTHPLLQGQYRWVRIQLDTPDTEIEVRTFQVQHVQDSTPFKGSFESDNPDLNRLWQASAYTAQIGAIPCSHTWDIVQNRLALRKLTKGHDAGILGRGDSWCDYDFSFTCALYHNPHFPTGIGWMVRAADRDHGYVCRLFSSGSLRIEQRSGTDTTVLAQTEIDPVEYEARLAITTSVQADTIDVRINDNTVLTVKDSTHPRGTIGFCMEDEHRAMVDSVTVTAPHGDILFEDTFSANLDSWEFDRSPYFLSDGAYRDRLPWVGDLYWGGRNVYYATGETICMKETLNIHRIHQTPQGFIWGTAYPEDKKQPASNDYGYWPSDEYSLWFAPVVADYLLFTGDTAYAAELFPSAKKSVDYALKRLDEKGLFRQEKETAMGQGGGYEFGSLMEATSSYINILLHHALKSVAVLASSAGAPEEAGHYARKAEKLRQTVMETFWDAEKGYLHSRPGNSHFFFQPNALALELGFVSPAQAERIAAVLPEHKATGKFMGTAASGLYQYGLDQPAGDILLGKKSPWMGALSDWRGVQGAVWESCVYPPPEPAGTGYRDMSHPDNAAAHILSAHILGIIPTKPGFREFLVQPHPSGCTSVKGSVPAPGGNIGVQWEISRESGSFTLLLDSPAETIATVRLPAGDTAATALKISGTEYTFENNAWPAGSNIQSDPNHPGSICVVNITPGSHELELRYL